MISSEGNNKGRNKEGGMGSSAHSFPLVFCLSFPAILVFVLVVVVYNFCHVCLLLLVK